MLDFSDIYKSEVKADAGAILGEIEAWANSLSDSFEDKIVYDALETVTDIIIDNCEFD